MVETFFTEKRIIKKIIIVLLFIFIFNFTFAHLGNNIILAEDEETSGLTDLDENDEKKAEEGGGKLLLPIHSLIIFITDSCLRLLQNSFLSTEPIILEAKSDSNRSAKGVGWIIGGILITAVAVLTWISPVPGDEAVGTSLAATWWAAGAGVKVMSTIALTATVAGPTMMIYGGSKLYKNLKGEFELPNIWYTPSEIFGNKVPLFDINFFKPSEDITEIKNVKKVETYELDDSILDVSIPIISLTEYLKQQESVSYTPDALYEYADNITMMQEEKIETYEKMVETINSFDLASVWHERGIKETLWAGYATTVPVNDCYDLATNNFLADTYIEKVDNLIDQFNKNCEDINQIVKEVYIKRNELSKDELKALKAKLPKAVEYKVVDEEEVIAKYESTSKVLQGTVASIYKSLRTLAIVALLSILVYTGIRIVISSTAKDKSKYKQMLMDWIVAFILLFMLHYLMAFIINVCELLTNVCSESDIDICSIQIPGDTEIYNEDKNEWGYLWEDENSESYGIWPVSFVGMIRFDAGLVQRDGYTMRGIASTIMYVVLVIYIIVFSFQYMRRVLYMAFLTMIAPLVAITYPLDKINDGKAQGFNIWLKEYIFNALLQPIHYIIYVIIMGSVMQLVIDHPVYALVALGFMTPAEKFIRKMFGFEKAATVSGFGGAAGAAMLMNGVQRLTGGGRGKTDKKDNGARGTQDNPNGKIKTINSMPSAPKGKNKVAQAEGKSSSVGGSETNTAVIGSGEKDSPGIRMANKNNGTIGEFDYDDLAMGHNINQEILQGKLSEDDLSDRGREQLSYFRDNTQNQSVVTGNEDEYFVDDHQAFGNGYNINQRISSGELSEDGLNDEQKDALDYWRSKNGYSNVASSQEEAISPPLALTPINQISEQRVIEPLTPQYEQYTKPKIQNRARGRLGQGLQSVGGFYVRRLSNQLRNGRPLRKMRRMITSALGAVTLGAIGLAAGIASGDASKAFQYTSAGALAGRNLGRNLGDKAADIIDLEGAGKAFEAGIPGDAKRKREKYKRDFKMNESNYVAGVSKVGAKGWKEMSKKDGIIDNALDYGINNLDDMSNIYRAQQAFMQREYAARGISNPNNLSKDKRDEIEKQSMKDAFAAYKLNKDYGNFWKDEKEDKNLTHTLKYKGFEGDEITEIKAGLRDKIEVYQDAELGQADYGEDTIRMQNQGDNLVDPPTPPDNPPTPPNNPPTPSDNPPTPPNNPQNGSQPTDDSSGDDRSQEYTPPQFPINDKPAEDAWARADALRAQEDAYKKQKAQEAEIRRLQEEHEATQQSAEQAKQTAQRAQYQQSKEKRNKIQKEYTKPKDETVKDKKGKKGSKDSTSNPETPPRTFTPPGGNNLK